MCWECDHTAYGAKVPLLRGPIVDVVHTPPPRMPPPRARARTCALGCERLSTLAERQKRLRESVPPVAQAARAEPCGTAQEDPLNRRGSTGSGLCSQSKPCHLVSDRRGRRERQRCYFSLFCSCSTPCGRRSKEVGELNEWARSVLLEKPAAVNEKASWKASDAWPMKKSISELFIL